MKGVDNVNLIKELTLDINGLGIIMYSDFATSHITEGEDYLSQSYQTPQQVANHIMEGSIVGFCTSSPGRYILNVRRGYPTESDLNLAEFKLRLGIEIRDGRMCIRDLYDLMSWRENCPINQCIDLENGYYHITLYGDVPSSGLLGDRQIIYVYLNKLNSMPALRCDGVPMFSQ
ncbi:hypothetical protein [Oceanirhabdus sp. W0125-5]|uniref:hypothetical protein n=1 Tax=Oceanirhabdus sp. W0125-5 TaxID=2999116 RepID=UPI0022F2FC49|nr:hypothetical protein [Oceanirhabdus sp. W0125-5]WBW96112.1 hypothetical protein OW730_20815 [Oceanirhabdus sp. W0125-5]